MKLADTVAKKTAIFFSSFLSEKSLFLFVFKNTHHDGRRDATPVKATNRYKVGGNVAEDEVIMLFVSFGVSGTAGLCRHFTSIYSHHPSQKKSIRRATRVCGVGHILFLSE